MYIPPTSILVDLIGAGVLLIITIPCGINIIKTSINRARGYAYLNKELYSDKDGVATYESQAYSVTPQNITLGILSLLGVAASLAIAILSLTDGYGDFWPGQGREVVGWLQFGISVLLFVQFINILSEYNPVKRFNACIAAAISHIIQSCLIFLVSYRFFYGHLYASGKIISILSTIHLFISLAAFFTCFAYPRRPDVYHQNHVVDGQWTVSAYSRFTYSWPFALLAQSMAGKQIQVEDLPMIDHHSRSEDLNNFYANQKGQGSLLKAVLLSHKGGFLRQMMLTILSSTVLIGPQFTMYKLLTLLELRDEGASVGVKASFWVIGLGLTMVVDSFVENWMWWVSYGQLNVPIRVQLSAIIFGKAMRRKDIKGGQSTSDSASSNSEATETNQANGHAEDLDEDKEGEAIQKTRQGTINLVGVDAKRVSDFATYAHLLYASVVTVAISFTFLVKLIGWQGLCAGLLAQLIFLPVNIYFTKKYVTAQDNLMKVRDQKLAVVSEALNGIRQIKFSALERQWQEKIGGIRDQELKIQWRAYVADAMLIFCWIMGPVLLSAVSISVYAVVNGSLSASVAFTTIAILSRIEGTLVFIPEIITDLIDALVSLRRIEKYLNSSEKLQITTPGDCVAFSDATISWPTDEDAQDSDVFKLKNINLEFPTGELSVISGRTGSGKSLLLAAILGEVEILSGKVYVPQAPSPLETYNGKANKDNWILPSALAFVSQIPWIENATFKDNVLFGLPYDATRYRQVISACALEKDLEILEDGDQTEIGANGINLSGGQRWRITLARAIYSRAGILVMDDIFSAVDAHVGRHIFEQALTGELCQGRTRILVTHHVSLCLSATKYEVRIGDGKIEYGGYVEELRKTGALDTIIAKEADEVAVEDEDQLADLPLSRTTSRRRSSHLQAMVQPDVHHRRRSSASRRSIPIEDIQVKANNQPKKFVEEEGRQVGRVQFSVYKVYMTASGGWWYWLMVIVLFGIFEALLLGRSWWLKVWTSRYDVVSYPQVLQTYVYQPYDQIRQKSTIVDPELGYYLGVYILISVILCIEGTLRYIWVYGGCVRAGRKLFEELTQTVLRAPLRWLDTVPVGRILNRFTSDFNSVDSTMGQALAFGFYNFMLVIGIIIAGVMVSPWIVLPAMLLLGVCVRFAVFYLAGARDTKRLESTAKSPVFELFSAALAGVASIRAFGKSDDYITSMFAKIDVHARTSYYMWLFNRWLTWRLSVVGAVFVVLMAGLIVSLEQIDAPLAGFALGFVLQYTEAVVWLLRRVSDVELGMNATERIQEYSEIQTEDDGGVDAPAAWPTEGRVWVNDLVIAYAPDLPPVLKGLTFEVEQNQRVGVVGRTGAGKSSLTLALFRFLEARRGSIHIDGLDISGIKLHDLRSRLAIIPQDPVLFSGTVRSNLDPFNEHADYELRDALERVHLTSSSRGEDEGPSSGSSSSGEGNLNIFNSLSSSIGEGGLNLSQGQRQLLCLARAVVARPKVMVLDEATSAVDKGTDELIQRSIREEFSDSTLLVIAHRLSTIADFDKILVMSEGLVAEYDTPKKLLCKPGGLFADMVENSGEKDVLRQLILGQD